MVALTRPPDCSRRPRSVGREVLWPVTQSFVQHREAYQAMLPYIVTRSSQLNQEFAFFPSAPPHAQGGVFELRTYQLKPGTLLEWENAWFVVVFLHLQMLIKGFSRRKGIEARRKFVAPIGAWFSQVGRLHQVHHLWQYEWAALASLPPTHLIVAQQEP